MKVFGYPKKEKIKKKNEISLLFDKGKWKTSGNLRIIYLRTSEIDQQKIGVSVSKRHFKKATDRNRIKRLLRECYRLNKETYTETFGANSMAMLFWISPHKPSHYRDVEPEFLNLCNSKK